MVAIVQSTSHEVVQPSLRLDRCLSRCSEVLIIGQGMKRARSPALCLTRASGHR